MATRQREKAAARIAAKDNRPMAKARYVRISPSKVRIILNLIRGKNYREAEAILAYNEANGTDYDAQELMMYLYEDLYSGVIPERDNAETFAQRRLEMLEILELIVADPAAGIAALEG